MAKLMPILAITLMFLATFLCHANDTSRKVYIVFLDSSIKSKKGVDLQILAKVLRGIKPAESLVDVYRYATNGFAARLTVNEAKKLKGVKGVLSVQLSKIHHPSPPAPGQA